MTMDVLLRAGKDDAELGHIIFLRKNAGGEVGHQRHLARFGELGVARAVDRIVAADVEIVRIGAEFLLVPIGNLRISDVLGGGDFLDVAVALGFLNGKVGKVAGIDVIRLAGFVAGEQVQRHLRKLHRRAALQKEHLVVFGNVHQRSQIRFRLCYDPLVHFRSVTHLHDGHSRVAVTNELTLGLFEYGQGQHRGAGRKIVDAVHNNILLKTRWCLKVRRVSFCAFLSLYTVCNRLTIFYLSL